MAYPPPWDGVDARYYQHGVDRGMIYPQNGDPAVWNGITGVDESSDSSSSAYYIDGVLYFADMDPGDFSGSLTAFFWPDEFAESLGIPKVTDGLYVDNQKPKRFGLSYRSLIGSGTEGDMFGYQIHLVYNAIASIATRSRKTVNDAPDIMEFRFDLVATPVSLPGYRPTAHYIIDTRDLDTETVTLLENIIYGKMSTPGRMPTPTELFDMLNFGSSIEVTSYVAEKVFTVRGNSSNVLMTDPYHFQINNINAVDNGDGTYTISDGGDTTVVEV